MSRSEQEGPFALVSRELEHKYELLESMEGGMGTVYKARHKLLGELRAIKTIRRKHLGKTDAMARFVREAKVAARLRNHHIAQLYDFSIDPQSDVAYIVFEYVDGSTLHDILSHQARIPVSMGLEIALQILAGLEYLHSQSVIHRDISPDNIMVANGTHRSINIKIIDFGIAKTLNASQALTHDGQFRGKLRYCSPEQLKHTARVDSRSDIYSFGVVLYEMLTGELPVSATDPPGWVAAHLSGEPRSFDQTDPDQKVPQALRRLILRTLSKDPADRFQSATELRKRLEAIAEPLDEPEERMVEFLQEVRREVGRARQWRPISIDSESVTMVDSPRILAEHRAKALRRRASSGENRAVSSSPAEEPEASPAEPDGDDSEPRRPIGESPLEDSAQDPQPLPRGIMLRLPRIRPARPSRREAGEEVSAGQRKPAPRLVLGLLAVFPLIFLGGGDLANPNIQILGVADHQRTRNDLRYEVNMNPIFRPFIVAYLTRKGKEPERRKLADDLTEHGHYTLVARVKKLRIFGYEIDLAGWKPDLFSASRKFYIDKLPPSFEIVANEISADTVQPFVRPLVGDAPQDLRLKQVLLNGQDWGYEGMNVDPITTEGHFNLRVTAADSTGNLDQVEFDFTVDHSPPTVTCKVAPTERARHGWRRSRTWIECRVEDEGTGVRQPGDWDRISPEISHRSKNFDLVEGIVPVAISFFDGAKNEAKWEETLWLDRTEPSLRRTSLDQEKWYSDPVEVKVCYRDELGFPSDQPKHHVVSGTRRICYIHARTVGDDQDVLIVEDPPRRPFVPAKGRSDGGQCFERRASIITTVMGPKVASMNEESTCKSFLLDSTGQHLIHSRSFDFAGNENPWSKLQVKIDREKPVIQALVEPRPNPLGWHQDSVEFSCGDAFSESGIVATWRQPEGLSLVEKSTEATCFAKNNAGVVGSSAVRILIDRHPPKLSFRIEKQNARAPEAWEEISLEESSTWFREPLRITVSAEDPESGLLEGSITAEGPGLDAESSRIVQPTFHSQYQAAKTLRVPRLSGEHHYRAAALDRADHASQQTLTVRHDSTPPTLKSFHLTRTEGGVAVEASYFDEHSGIFRDRVFLLLNHQTVQAEISSVSLKAFVPLDHPWLRAGRNDFVIRLLDHAGNESIKSEGVDIASPEEDSLSTNPKG